MSLVSCVFGCTIMSMFEQEPSSASRDENFVDRFRANEGLPVIPEVPKGIKKLEEDYRKLMKDKIDRATEE